MYSETGISHNENQLKHYNKLKLSQTLICGLKLTVQRSSARQLLYEIKQSLYNGLSWNDSWLQSKGSSDSAATKCACLLC